MYLLGDIGNSETKICLINSNFRIIKRMSFKSKGLTKKILSKKLSFIKLDNLNSVESIFCSVVPSSLKIIKKVLLKKRIKLIELKDISLKNLININVNKKQIGSDRLANALSVIDKKNNYIVIDFGTATTFDVIVKKNYLGGVIAPGVNLSLDTLSLKASLIPTVKLAKVTKVIGKNTTNAVQSGFYWGYTGLINSTIQLIKKQTKKNFKIVLTGGLAHLFKNSINIKASIDKDLTIKGLIKLMRFKN